MTDLAALVATRRTDANRFSADFPEGWLQGRTVFGGITIGTGVDAAVQWISDPSLPLRSVNFALAAPTEPGPVIIDVEEVRRGSKTAVVVARLSQNDTLAATATLVFGQPRDETCRWQQVPQPRLPRYADSERMWRNNREAPEFAQHIEYRPTRGRPFSGASEAVVEGWIGPIMETGEHSAATIALLTDIWWPAGYAMETGPRPIATIASTIQLYPLVSLARDEPAFHRGVAPIAQSGYVTEFRELWTESGSLLATNQQTFVWI